MVHELGARRAASLDPGKRWIMAALGVSALLCVAALAPAAAQQKGAEGQGDSKDVIVDLSALDQLGSSPSAPGGGTIVLTPPGLKPGKKPAGKAQPAAAKGRVAAKPAPAAAKASSPPPPPPQSAAAAPAAESHAPDSTASAAPAIKTKASESPALAASAAAQEVQEKSAPTLPTTESTPPEGAPPDAAGAAGATLPMPPAAAVVASPGSAPPQPAGANRAAPAAARPQSATSPQLAAKPSALPLMPSAFGGEKALSLRFDSGATELTDAAKNELGKLAATLKKSSDQRLQVVAYAAGTDAEASQARRLALSRALAVRSYLIEQGIGSSRMDVRALGNKNEGVGPADRVDLVLIGNK